MSHNGTECHFISWFIVKEQRGYGRRLTSMDKFKSLLSFTQKRQSNLGFGLIALITAGSEHIFSVFAFKCPCNDWNFVYGNVCLLVPALALLFLSYMLSNKTWKLFTGLCLRKSKLCRFNYAIGILCVFLQITTTAMVAPLSWIAVALLKGVYFECSMTGANITLFRHHLCNDKFPHCRTELENFPCDGTAIPQSERVALLSIIRAESQVSTEQNTLLKRYGVCLSIVYVRVQVISLSSQIEDSDRHWQFYL